MSPSSSPIIDKKDQLDPINPKLDSPNFKDEKEKILDQAAENQEN